MEFTVSIKFLRWTLSFSVAVKVSAEPRSVKDKLIEAILHAAESRGALSETATGETGMDW